MCRCSTPAVTGKDPLDFELRSLESNQFGTEPPSGARGVRASGAFARSGRVSSWSKRALILLFGAFLVMSLPACQSGDDNSDTELLTLLGLLQPLGDYWARLYYVDPLIIFDEQNINLIREATAADTFPGQKKLVLIPGWDTGDRSDGAFPSAADLETRALVTNWNHLFTTSEFDQLVTSDNYQIFVFDYLTSDAIGTNGIRFKNKLDQVFGSLSSPEVIIYAHSMGGVVTRSMLYEGARPSYLKAALLNGSPLHGSPWASSEFLADKSVLEALAGYLTATTGGQDLRWDNFDNSLPGASNPFLTELNAKTGRDDLVHLTYAEVPDATTFDEDGSARAYMKLACPILDTGAMYNGDCLVPTTSAILSGLTTASAPQNLGRYEHFQINWHTAAIRNALRTKINSL